MLILMEHDLPKAIEFYQKLGLKLIFHLKDKWAEMRLGDVKIGLCPTSKPQEGHTGIVFEVDDMHAAFDALKKDGVEFLNEPVEATHGIMVSLKDPHGNIIDLYQPTPEKVAKLMKETAKADRKEDGCCGAQDVCCKTGKA